ncbi:hypothetical protein ES703_90012 [subsurface metagenome]
MAKSFKSDEVDFLLSPVSKSSTNGEKPLVARKGKSSAGILRSHLGSLALRVIFSGALLIASSTRELGIFTISPETSAPFLASNLRTFSL